MPKRLKNGISLTPRHGPSENVQKRKVRKVSNFADYYSSVYEYVYFTHAYIYFYVSYLHTEEKSLDQLHKDYYLIILLLHILIYLTNFYIYLHDSLGVQLKNLGKKKGDYCLINIFFKVQE